MTGDLELVEAAIGTPPIAREAVRGAGYTSTAAWRVETRAGPVFVKEASDRGGLAMLRREALVYRRVSGSFLPALVGYADAGDRAVLAIEYLARAHWPPPYPDDVTPLFTALEQVAAAEPPPELPAEGARPSHWQVVAADPEPFLELGLCTREWLEASIDTLVAFEARAPFEGEALVHNDVYSGNVCFSVGNAMLVDWGAAVRGSEWVDVAFALLSLRVEGAAVPEVEFPFAGPFAAALSGHFAVEAPAPLPAWAEPGSTLRQDMAGDLAHALGWAVETVGLPPLT